MKTSGRNTGYIFGYGFLCCLFIVGCLIFSGCAFPVYECRRVPVPTDIMRCSDPCVAAPGCETCYQVHEEGYTCRPVKEKP